MSEEGHRRFISLLVYKMYKRPTRLESMSHRPMAPLWPVAVPLESMPLDVRAARDQLVQKLGNAPKESAPGDLPSYVGFPVPGLGLTVPTGRAIVAGFAEGERD